MATSSTIPSNQIGEVDWNFSVGDSKNLLDKLNRMPSNLGKIAARIGQGIRTSANEVYVLDKLTHEGSVIEARSEKLSAVVEIEANAATPFLQGREIKRYNLLPTNKVVIIPYRVTKLRTKRISENAVKRKFPLTYQYLVSNKPYLENREHGKMHGSFWYGYVYPKNADLMKQSKILVPDIADKAAFALDEEGTYAFTSGYGITLKQDVPESLKYLLGLLNSRLLNFYLKSVSTPMRGGFFRYFTQFMQQIPICRVDFGKPAEKAKHDKMVGLVERMLKLHKDKAAARLATEKNMLQMQIEATDTQIDMLVYALYGLTDDEIKVVEGAG